MSFYQSSAEFYDVMQEVFKRLTADPEAVEEFSRSNLVIRLRTTDPECEILLDGRQPPIEVFYGPRPGSANLELHMSADTLHKVWTSEIRLRDAFFNGQVETKGNVFQAMKLTDLFRQAEAIYPQVLQEKGLHNT